VELAISSTGKKGEGRKGGCYMFLSDPQLRFRLDNRRCRVSRGFRRNPGPCILLEQTKPVPPRNKVPLRGENPQAQRPNAR